jgi:hypothetical protein
MMHEKIRASWKKVLDFLFCTWASVASCGTFGPFPPTKMDGRDLEVKDAHNRVVPDRFVRNH